MQRLSLSPFVPSQFVRWPGRWRSSNHWDSTIATPTKCLRCPVTRSLQKCSAPSSCWSAYVHLETANLEWGSNGALFICSEPFLVEHWASIQTTCWCPLLPPFDGQWLCPIRPYHSNRVTRLLALSLWSWTTGLVFLNLVALTCKQAPISMSIRRRTEFHQYPSIAMIFWNLKHAL